MTLVKNHAAWVSFEAAWLDRALAGDEQAAQSLLHALGSENPYLRELTAQAFHCARSPQSWQALLGCFAHRRWLEMQDWPLWREAQWVRLLDATIIAAFSHDNEEEEAALKNAVLQSALGDERPLCFAAAVLLGLRGDKTVVAELARAIELGERRWQLLAIHALATMKDEHGAVVLVRALAMDRDLLHREANHALRDLGSVAETAWLEALNHPDSHIRWHAARALGDVGGERATALLADGLLDENRAVRWASAEALAHLDWAAAPTILRLLSRAQLDAQHREAIAHALSSMPGQNTRQRLHPVIEALRGASAGYEAPAAAARLLAELGAG